MLDLYKQTSAEEELAGSIIKRFEMMQSSSSRGNLNSHCQEIAELIWPSQKELFASMQNSMSEGEKRNSKALDSTASAALNKFATILDSLLTPMDQTWHRIMPDDDYLLRDRPTVLWLEELNRRIFKKRYASHTNFVAQNQLVYKSLGAWGTGALFTDEYVGKRGDKGLRYRNVHLSELFFIENHQGMIDDVYRYYKASAHQIVKRWGRRAPESVHSKMKSDPNYQYFLLHVVTPRDNVDYERKDSKGMEFVSYYASIDGKILLEEGGYNSFPYGISRYEQVPGEVYGRSPAMEALAAMKVLNEEKKTLLTQGHRAIAPPLFAFDDGVIDTYNIKPGSVNMGGVSADGKLLVHAMPVGNLSLTKEMMDDERMVINDLFLVPLFQMLEKNPQMTATEVTERMREKATLLAPTVGRQYSSYHARVIEREIDIVLRQSPDLMQTIPQVFVQYGAPWRLRYESPMARMQRSDETAGLMRTVETAINVSTQTQDPRPLDHFNWDAIIPDISDNAGVPSKWRNGPDEIQAIRDARAQQAQQQQDIQAAPAVAGMIKANAMAKKTQQVQ